MKGADKTLRKDTKAETLIRTLSHNRGGAITHHYCKITVTKTHTGLFNGVNKTMADWESGAEVLFPDGKTGITEPC